MTSIETELVNWKKTQKWTRRVRTTIKIFVRIKPTSMQWAFKIIESDNKITTSSDDRIWTW